MKNARQSGSAHIIIIIFLVLALAAALGWIFWQNFIQKDSNVKKPTNYTECIAAEGSLLQATYPEVCVTKDGDRFVNPNQKVQAPVEEESKGLITGNASYPSEGLPEDEEVCAENIADKSKVYCINVGRSGAIGYELEVPVGKYYVYSKTKLLSGYKAYYNEYVKCGLKVTCPDSGHDQYIPVEVKANETVSDVDPGDWYATD
jgi:hypothetical protein